MLHTDPLEFAEKLPPEGRVLGLDMGSKTIGVAMSDTSRTVATPYTTLKRGKFTSDAATLKKLLEEFQVCGLVIGLPLEMSGDEGKAVQSVKQFARNLDNLLKINILFWDERHSTSASERMLIEGDLSRARRKELIDKIAASYILQGALDRIKFTN